MSADRKHTENHLKYPLNLAGIVEAVFAPGELGYKRSLRYCEVITGDKDLAEEAYQEAYLRILRNSSRFKEKVLEGGIEQNPAVKAYWFRALKDTSKMYKKRKNKNKIRFRNFEDVELGLEIKELENSKQPLDVLFFEELSKIIMDNLVNPCNFPVPKKELYKDVVRLRQEGYKISEIGEILGIPTRTVKMRLHSVRKNLLEKLPSVYQECLPLKYQQMAAA